jgi:hypothetical protein
MNIKSNHLEDSAREFRERLARWTLSLLIVGGLLYVAVTLWNRPPQMGPSEDVFKTVDALYTAVTSHNDGRLAQCEKRLTTLKEKGELPDSAASALTSIINRAKAGDWQSASTHLYAFMLAQRRDGAGEIDKHHEKKTIRKSNTIVVVR